MLATRLSSLTLLLTVTAVGCGDDTTPPTDSGTGDTATGGDTAMGGDTATGGDTAMGGSVCERACVFTLAGACPNGPLDTMECVATCEMHRAGPCTAPLMTYLTCGEGMDVACDAGGLPVVTACMTEYVSFAMCLESSV